GPMLPRISPATARRAPRYLPSLALTARRLRKPRTRAGTPVRASRNRPTEATPSRKLRTAPECQSDLWVAASISTAYTAGRKEEPSMSDTFTPGLGQRLHNLLVGAAVESCGLQVFGLDVATE